MKVLIKKIAQKAIPDRIRYHLTPFSIDRDTEMFIKHNKEVWGAYKVKNPTSEILVDFYPVSQTLIAYSYFLNILANKHNAEIKTFASGNPLANPTFYKTYQSFNTSGYVVPPLDENTPLNSSIFHEVIRRIKSKKDLLELHIRNIWVGVDIYETYLNKYNKPTVDIKDPRLFDEIKRAIELLIFWENYLDTNRISAIVVSHDVYLHLNILCKLAYRKCIPVYLPYMLGVTYADKPFSHFKMFKHYKSLFNTLSTEEQIAARTLAKKQIEKRYSGETGVNMSYMTKSAFSREVSGDPVLRKSDKIKVLIATHCFYDSPHGYGGMLFVDFYEWICYLGRIAQHTDYDWYIKVHPDPLPGTLKVINELISKFPHITLIPQETSFHQLVKEGLNFALTAYGSIGHELPGLGVQVINAAYNPHISYGFNWHAKSLDEYEYYLLNLDKLNKKVDMQEVYEFYYMNYYFFENNNLFLDRYSQFCNDLKSNQRIGPEAYSYFLNQWGDKRHEHIINTLSAFIDSGKRELSSCGPVLSIED